MRFLQNSFVVCFIGAVALSMVCSSCGKDSYVETLDTVRGMWGSALLYNEQGLPETDNSGITINVRCVDTINMSSTDTTVWDTSYTISTDSKGNWELYKPKGGWYYMDFSKPGYCKNSVYAFAYDTSSADTLETVYLAKPTQGSIELDSISITDGVLSIYRTMFFTANYASYSLATWYFFGSSPEVSSKNYSYMYVSGSATSNGQQMQSGLVYKPLDKLLESGLAEGSTVYVRAYCDNARAVTYQVADSSWVFPNLLEGSNVLSFVIPETE